MVDIERRHGDAPLPWRITRDHRGILFAGRILAIGESVAVVPADLHQGVVEAFKRFGTHRPECALRIDDEDDYSVECDCGYSTAKATIEGQ